MLGNVLNSSQQRIPHRQKTDLVTFTVKVNNAVINSQYRVKSLLITKQANKIASAKVTLLDGDVASQNFQASSQNTFSPGNTIELRVGYHSDEDTLFKGIIIRHGIKIRQGRTTTLDLECKDEAVKMTVGSKSMYFYDQTDTAIIDTVVSAYKLDTDFDDTDLEYPEMVQYEATDWDFVLKRAEANGMLVFTDDGIIRLKAVDFDQDAKFPVVYGTTLWEFEAEMDARDQYPAVEATAWDYAQQELVSREESASDGASAGGLGGALGAIQNVAAKLGLGEGDKPNTDHSHVLGLEKWLLPFTATLNETELDTLAKAQLTKSRLARNRGRVKFQGYHDIKPGDCLDIKGVGGRFSEKVYVTAVRHEVGEGNWFTDARFGLEQDWIPGSMPITPTMSRPSLAINGLQIGLVTQIDADPNGQDRILVRLPHADNKDNGIWARVASIDAGDNRGVFFRPYVNDEVVVGFLNNDPRHAIILGVLNSHDTKSAPFTASEDNFEKGIVTREQLKFVFHEDQKSITLETPGNRKITLNDQEGHITLSDDTSSIVLNDEGIQIKSQKKIVIDGQQGVDVSSLQDISIEATQNLKAHADLQAEFSATTQLSVKGLPVNIN